MLDAAYVFALDCFVTIVTSRTKHHVDVNKAILIRFIVLLSLLAIVKDSELTFRCMELSSASARNIS